MELQKNDHLVVEYKVAECYHCVIFFDERSNFSNLFNFVPENII